jgi:zinc transport system ATP-binding protein
MIKPLIHIHHLTFAWDREPVLEDIDLKIFDNDFIGMTGPNGGGKTTLIKAILGIIQPQKGKIYFREDLPRNKRPIGYLPQLRQLDRNFPIVVQDVIRSGSLMRNIPFQNSEAEKKKVGELLHEMGIEGLRKKAIGELSGGEMQRVFLCRALISDPKVLILDEPGTYVDNRFGKELFDKLKNLNERMAVLLISHDTDMVKEYAKTIVYVDRRLSGNPDQPLKIEGHA